MKASREAQRVVTLPKTEVNTVSTGNVAPVETNPMPVPVAKSDKFAEPVAPQAGKEQHTPHVGGDLGWGTTRAVPSWQEIMAGKTFTAAPVLETASMKLDARFDEPRESNDYRNFDGRTLTTVDGLSNSRVASDLANALTTAFGGEADRGAVQRFDAGEVRLKFTPGQRNHTGRIELSAGGTKNDASVPPTLQRSEATAVLAKVGESLRQQGFTGEGETFRLAGPELTLAAGQDRRGDGVLEMKRADGQPLTQAQTDHLFDKVANLIAGNDALPFRNSEDVIRVGRRGSEGGGMTSIMIVRDETQKVTLRASNEADQRFMQNVFNQLFDR